MDTPKIAKDCGAIQWQKFPAKPRLPTCNVLVSGKTGAGKSTLINAVFGEQLAETGIGLPVTDKPRRYAKDGIPVTVLDTRGLELGECDGRGNEFTEEIDQRAVATGDEQLHVAWYCIAAPSDRIDEGEERHLAALASRLPIIVVVTMSFERQQADELARQIAEYSLAGVWEVLTVIAEPRQYCGETIGACGLDGLVRATLAALNNRGLKMAFLNAQRVSLPEKLRKAEETLQDRINETNGITAKLAHHWGQQLDLWSIRPVQNDLMCLLTELALPFGMSVPHLNQLIEEAEHEGRGVTSSADYWLRNVHRDTSKIDYWWANRNCDVPFENHARKAIMHIGRLYLRAAEKVALADINGKPLSREQMRQLLNNLKEVDVYD